MALRRRLMLPPRAEEAAADSALTAPLFIVFTRQQWPNLLLAA